MSYEIKTANQEEMSTMVGWAAKEGWNPDCMTPPLFTQQIQMVFSWDI